MRGVSRESLASGHEALNGALGESDTQARALGEELFGVAQFIDGSAVLRRALTDSNAKPSAKAELVSRLFGGKVSDAAVSVISALAQARWSASRDLADSLEVLGQDAVIAQADSEGSLDTVEDEVFRFGRIVDQDQPLHAALSDSSRSAADRGTLVDNLLGLRANPATVALIRQAVVAPRGRGLDQILDDIGEAISDRRQRSVAVVTSAVALSPAQRDRLKAALTRIYGRDVHLNEDIDPHLLGGVKIQVGDEVIDGSVVSRLDEAKRRIAG